MHPVLFEIGGIAVEFESPLLRSKESIPANYSPFIKVQEPLVTIRHHMGNLPDLKDWTLRFDSGGIWNLYSRRDQWAISVRYGVNKEKPYHIAILRTDFLEGEIITAVKQDNQHSKIELFYPLMELIFANLLGNRRGLLIHGCAVKIGGKGLLFAGTSGAGKSTLARLWATHPEATLLSDDRLILRKDEDGFRIFGTPWHGDARAVSAENVQLHQVFILKHALENFTIPLRPVTLTAQLLARSFPPYWSFPAMEYSMELLSEFSQAVPGYEFGFTPDQRAIDSILRSF